MAKALERTESIPDDRLFGDGGAEYVGQDGGHCIEDFNAAESSYKPSAEGKEISSDDDDSVFTDKSWAPPMAQNMPDIENLYTRSSNDSEDSSRSGRSRHRSSGDSMTARDKRESFRNSKNLEQNEDEAASQTGDSQKQNQNEDSMPGRRTRSMPDLVECAKECAQEKCSNSLGLSPDVTIADCSSLKQLELEPEGNKEPAIPQRKDMANKKAILVQRSVSFDVNPPRVAEVERDDDGNSVSMRIKSDDSDSAANRRRNRFSSGYGTGGSSQGSKASSIQSQTSQERTADVTETADSVDDEGIVDSMTYSDNTETQNDSGKSVSGSSSCSFSTVIPREAHSGSPCLSTEYHSNLANDGSELSASDQLPQASPDELPMLSIFDQSFDGPGKVSMKSQSQKEEVNLSDVMKQAEEFRRSHTSTSDKQMLELNIPDFHTLYPNEGSLFPDDSVQLASRTIQDVHNEDEKERLAFVNKYLHSESRQVAVNDSADPGDHIMKIGNQSMPGASQATGGEGTSPSPVVDPGLLHADLNGSMPSSMTENRRKLEEYLTNKPKPLSPEDVQKLHLLLCNWPSESSTPSPSPLQGSPERARQLQALGLQAMSPAQRLITRSELEKASRCQEDSCTEPACKQLRDVELHVESVTSGIRPLDEAVSQWCSTLWDHCVSCDEVRCPVTFCPQLVHWSPNELNTETVIWEIHQWRNNPLLSFLPPAEGRFTKLIDSVDDTPPQEYISYIPITRLGKQPTSAVLTQDLLTQKSIVIKEHPLLEDDHQVAVYEKLRNLKHPHLVAQLYINEYSYANPSVLHVASEFMPGGSLKDHLTSSGPLHHLLIVNYMKQAMAAVDFLHRRNIVYLYWTSENILFADTQRRVLKLGNFSLSCYCDDGQEWDIGSLKMCLPANICPPELILEDMVSWLSDVWGMGCLMVEMVTGKPVWYGHRHDDRDTIHKLVTKETPLQQVPRENLPRDMEALLHRCLQTDPSRRIKVMELKNYFHSLR